MSWPRFSFGEVFDDVTGGNHKVKTGDYLEEGKYPIVDQGMEQIAGYVNDAEFLCKATKPCILFGDHTKILKFINFDFALGADGVKVLKPSKRLDPRFAYFFLRTVKFPPKTGYMRHFKYLKRAMVPVPPLEEQRRIAAILDKAGEVEQASEKVQEMRDEIIQATFLDMFGIESPEWPIVALSDVAEISCDFVNPTDSHYFDLPHIGPDRIKGFTGEILPYRTARQDNVTSGKFYFSDKEILYSKIRPYLRKCAMPTFEGLCSADVYPITPSKQIAKEFLWYLLLSDRFDRYTQTLPDRASIPKLNRKELWRFRFALPPIQFQQEFADIVQQITDMDLSALENHATTLKASLTQELLA